MPLDFRTIDDLELKDKTVLLRIDINSPVDPHTGNILDDTRLKLHSDTIEELANMDAKVVILAHQSRPGKKDFTTLEEHAKVLSDIIGRPVKYVEDIFGCAARDEISKMKKGDIILLENVRFYSEEILKREPSIQAKTHLVRKLSPLVDYYINDAFAAAHRSQPSLVGFPMKLPSAAGRIMEKELKVLYSALENVKRPCVYVLGGVKVDDSIKVMANVLKKGSADHILTTGFVANVFLKAAKIDIGKCNEKLIKKRGYTNLIKVARKLMKKFNGKILIPVDVAVCKDDKRVEVPIDDIPNLPIYDIGLETIKIYAEKIRSAKTIVANGPAGVFENPEFSIGTEDLLNAISSSNGFSIIGGGHLAAAAVQMGFEDGMNHISSGGGAAISLLAGEELPAVKVLCDSVKS
ncbi:MAG TPA: phosphoglycerate kinase [Methanothermobacter sp.]|nr:phosphoglycerate kinase [Methanothermobacter sp. MT-2]HHW05450.1 phosphoglycerate kinase [Methanothermobacter sp.]HOK73214.1 phosphoglycerate kinase [Methanothermobacter sp.]HOL68838.1 phosphoglycerate kinase [Methanothermobacter sp.]HPQ04731.1 phosphoglycerate kinase [Methanothermobacter sp.]